MRILYCALASVPFGIAVGFTSNVAYARSPASHTSVIVPPAVTDIAVDPETRSATVTLEQALARAYIDNPVLREERAMLRSVDEGVPTALSGWRPNVQVGANASYYSGEFLMAAQGANSAFARNYDVPGYDAGVMITQPLFRGGATIASTHKAINNVHAERARLVATEQQVMEDVISAYVGLIETQKILELSINNEKVLQAQSDATRSRFGAGDVTRTDTAQADTALSIAHATRQDAEAAAENAKARYMQVVGDIAPDHPIMPSPYKVDVKNEKDAVVIAKQNNPNILFATSSALAAKNSVSVAMAALLPKISVNAGYDHSINQSDGRSELDNKFVMLSASLPLYQGGAEYAAVRQARQQWEAAQRAVDVQNRAVTQQTITFWNRMQAYRQEIESTRSAVETSVIAVRGVERQAMVGTGTTLAALQQQQTALIAQVALVRSQSNYIRASYGMAAALGRLNAETLNLDVPHYDEKAYYHDVKFKLFGLGDYALHQPGR
ncbi:TolC family outer membrane protein [Komagataeibacter sp. FXV3]|nr:TolC family outer membrane protein [Komagataeibacter sp. FXV3]